MSPITTLLLLALSSTLSFAQAVKSSDASIDIFAERARIQSEREIGDSRFSQQEAACYAMFAVTDCLHEVQLQRRQLKDALRRQTLVLNDLERRRKTLLKRDQAELKTSP